MTCCEGNLGCTTLVAKQSNGFFLLKMENICGVTTSTITTTPQCGGRWGGGDVYYLYGIINHKPGNLDSTDMLPPSQCGGDTKTSTLGSGAEGCGRTCVYGPPAGGQKPEKTEGPKPMFWKYYENVYRCKASWCGKSSTRWVDRKSPQRAVHGRLSARRLRCQSPRDGSEIAEHLTETLRDREDRISGVTTTSS